MGQVHLNTLIFYLPDMEFYLPRASEQVLVLSPALMVSFMQRGPVLYYGFKAIVSVDLNDFPSIFQKSPALSLQISENNL